MNNLPWTTGRLGIWAICGMNHYYVGGTRHLFVSMVYDGRCNVCALKTSLKLHDVLYPKMKMKMD